MRTLLRMDPWVPSGKLWIAPVLPEGFGSLKISHPPLAGTGITVETGDGSEEVPVVTGLPEEISLIAGPRPASTASLHAARQSG